MKINCRHCDRYLFTASSTTIVEGVVCSNSKCKAKLNIKVIFNDDATHEQMHHKFTTPEQPPKGSK